jgi:hypothetical protein
MKGGKKRIQMYQYENKRMVCRLICTLGVNALNFVVFKT